MSNSNHEENHDVFFIPPNFLTSGRLFGGMLRARNAIEAGVLALVTVVPIVQLPVSLSTKVIIMCLTTLPLTILGCIGIDGDSITEFLINWVRWLRKRDCLHRWGADEETEQHSHLLDRHGGKSTSKPPSELGIKIREKVNRPTKQSAQAGLLGKRRSSPLTTESLVSVKDIRNGIVETEDGRYTLAKLMSL